MPSNTNTPRVRLSAEDSAGSWGPELERAAIGALDFVQSKLGVELDAPPTIESIQPEQAFYDALGRRPHRLVAVAISGTNKVLINRQKYIAGDAARRWEVLVHEFTHLILGRMIPGGVPRWLDEGLAMIVAGETSFRYSLRVSTAATFGNLVSLENLWASKSGPAADQELAYAESASATRYFLKVGVRDGFTSGGDSHGDAGALVRRLADPERGEALRHLLRDPVYIRAFEKRWRSSLKTIWTWVAALSGGSFLWIAMTGLFLLAYWRKRRLAKQTEERWREEEEAFPYLE